VANSAAGVICDAVRATTALIVFRLRGAYFADRFLGSGRCFIVSSLPSSSACAAHRNLALNPSIQPLSVPGSMGEGPCDVRTPAARDMIFLVDRPPLMAGHNCGRVLRSQVAPRLAAWSSAINERLRRGLVSILDSVKIAVRVATAAITGMVVR